MGVWLATLLYLSVAGFAGLMTLSEQRRRTARGPLWQIASALACLVWPLTLLAMLVAMRFGAARPGQVSAAQQRLV